MKTLPSGEERGKKAEISCRLPSDQKNEAREFAAAKVNLALHVVGHRKDGYHLLDTLVAFPKIGDWLYGRFSESFSLSIGGHFSETLNSAEPKTNLIWKAAHALWESKLLAEAKGGPPLPIHFFLEKNLPVAAGIGGGSADAAAALRMLYHLWGLTKKVALLSPELMEIACKLGADVPMCLDPRPRRLCGTGEIFQEEVTLPQAGFILVTPPVALSTPVVFSALTQKENAPLPPLPSTFPTLPSLVAWLRETRNDLEGAASQRIPQIRVSLEALRGTKGIAFARMSGSGPSCYGLYANLQIAQKAAESIAHFFPDSWVRCAPLCSH